MKVKSALNVEMMYTALVVDRGAVRLYTCWARGGRGGILYAPPRPQSTHKKQKQCLILWGGATKVGRRRRPNAPQCHTV